MDEVGKCLPFKVSLNYQSLCVPTSCIIQRSSGGEEVADV